MGSREHRIPESPSGTLTFLFTDIEGSTRRWEAHLTAMKAALRIHDTIVRDAIEQHDGYVFKNIGDAWCAAFVATADALAAALELQRRLVREDFSAVGGLRVRVAVHVGIAEERDNDYFGPTVNRVARLLAIAHGGQVLLSAAAAALIAEHLPAGVRVRDLGDHTLKDLSRAEYVFQLVADDLPSEFPPLSTARVGKNNLPFSPNRLIGREVEIATITEMLRSESCACVTLIGSGGVGKTRSALHVGARLLDSFEDGVWFVDLAPLLSSDAPSAFAAAVGMQQPADGDTVRALVEFLRRKRLLLIVDNCEHVIVESARIITRVLESCAGVRVFATSREPLRIAGECLYQLPSLAFPPEARVVADDVLRYDACALFIERAEAARRNVVATDDDLGHIGEICRRLDGIPLAIELAAARVRMFTFAELERRLDDRFNLLTQGLRTALPRQRTIRAVIDWSYDHLSASEKRLFRRLSVFADSWSLEAAETVCCDDLLAASDIVALVLSLLDKSLVNADLGDKRARYHFLETTKTYASEKLLESGESEQFSLRHARWIARVVEELDAGAATEELLERCGEELANLRAALGWSLLGGASPLLGARIASSIRRLCYEGLQADGRRWIRAAIDAIDEEREPKVAAALWHGLASLSIAQRAIDAATRSIALAEKARDDRIAAMAHVHLAFAQWQTGRMQEAERSIERALELYLRRGFERTWLYADALDTLGNILLNLGRLDEARVQYGRALQLYVACRERLGAARVRGNLAELEFARGDPHAALTLINDAAAAFRDCRSTTREAMAVVNAASYYLALGEVDAARRSASAALTSALRLEDQQLCAIAIQHLARAAAADGEMERAAVLIGFVDEWFRKERYEREWSEARGHDLLMGSIRIALDLEQIERAIALGADMNVYQAADRAVAPA